MTAAFRSAGVSRSTIRDFCGIAELNIVDQGVFKHTIRRASGEKTNVKKIEMECRRTLRAYRGDDAASHG